MQTLTSGQRGHRIEMMWILDSNSTYLSSGKNYSRQGYTPISAHSQDLLDNVGADT